MVSQRADYGKNANECFAAHDDLIADLAAELRSLIQRAVPAASESIKWGMPVYEQGGSVCSLRAGKGYVALQFGTIGTSLVDPDSLLEGSGKRARHVKIRSTSDIDKQRFTSWIKQAAKAKGKEETA